ncbi:hypothetical protein [Tenacibaculum agarivorans]|uniref:hypothetical protein n=1 Tax=Tenacibaculum agarivorans TaxID=1908389 RepID=UPI000AEEADD0|nr:hypothetical protein [Tenacibaculum agarivorans]
MNKYKLKTDVAKNLLSDVLIYSFYNQKNDKKKSFYNYITQICIANKLEPIGIKSFNFFSLDRQQCIDSFKKTLFPYEDLNEKEIESIFTEIENLARNEGEMEYFSTIHFNRSKMIGSGYLVLKDIHQSCNAMFLRNNSLSLVILIITHD